MADEGRDVGAEEVLALAEADDERAVAAGADDDAGAVGVDGEQGERALEPVARRCCMASVRSPVAAYSRATRCAATSVSVSLLEGDTGLEQLALELVEVLDDAVVDQGQPAVLAAAVRVGVLVGRAAVGGPAGVADAGAWRRGGRRPRARPGG